MWPISLEFNVSYLCLEELFLIHETTVQYIFSFQNAESNTVNINTIIYVLSRFRTFISLTILNFLVTSQTLNYHY